MTPTQIATQAAEQFVYEAQGPNAWKRYDEEERQWFASIILTAAAKMVRETGAVEALEKWDDESAVITPPDQKDFVDVQMSPEAYEGLYAALQSLRSITGEAGK